MKHPQQGFTLVELVVVIAILGLLASIAVPKFINLTSDAGTSAAAGVASALISGSSINYSVSLAKGVTSAAVVRINGATACSALATTLMTGFDSTSFTITGTSGAGCATAGTTFTCSISSTQSGSTQTTATLLCTG